MPTSRYHDPARSAGACSRVAVRSGKHIKVTCATNRGTELYRLDRGQSEDPVRVDLRTGIEGLYCARFDAGVRLDGSNGRTFIALGAGTAPNCP